ncbi:MAG: PGF-CTERM sorting domain-containing protein [Euryarchaeota archaeon]|nr:PGF-CTERM sorting domain-containing protein [Euryarchaeota archaeon]
MAIVIVVAGVSLFYQLKDAEFTMAGLLAVAYLLRRRK